MKNGLEPCIARAKAYAPYSDLIWMETGTPDLELAKKFAEGVKSEFPDQMLAYNCSPSFNWKQHLDDDTIAKFQRELGAMGFKFQFITLAGFHALNYSMFDLAYGYAREQMKRTSSCRSASSPPRAVATPRRSTSARSAPATSTGSPPPWTRPRRPPRSRVRPKRASSTRSIVVTAGPVLILGGACCRLEEIL